MARPSTFRRFLRTYVRPYRPHLVFALVCLIAYAIASSLMLYLVKPLFGHLFDSGRQDPAIPGAASEGLFNGWRAGLDQMINYWIESSTVMGTLERICVLIVIVTLCKAVFFYLQGWAISHLQQGAVKHLRDTLYTHLHRLSLSYFERNRTGHLMSRVTNDVLVIEEALEHTPTQLVRDPLLIIFYLYLLLAISWQLTLLASAIVPTTAFLVARLGYRLRSYSERSQEKMADLNDILDETIHGIRVVKAFSMGPHEIGKFSRATQDYFKTMIKLVRIRLISSPAGEVMGSITGAVVIWVGGRFVYLNQTLSPAEFITFLVLMFALARPVKALSIVHIRIQRAMAAVDRVFELLDTSPEIVDRPNARPVQGRAGRIVFDSVSFAYDEGPDVLSDISVEVEPGEILAIVGVSGSGKSTFLDLIPRFYDPTRGFITLGGSNLRDLQIDSLRSCMGIVTQEIILFNDTIFRNIAYGHPESSVAQVEHAAQMANAHDFVCDLPEGYDTMIGNRGVRLSGGQRQRLAIARALLKDPEILVFDEATSALDSEAELLVQEAIDRLMKNRTVFVVAHRLSTIRHANRILVLDRGRIVESGTHAALHKANGQYRYLHDLQFMGAPNSMAEPLI